MIIDTVVVNKRSIENFKTLETRFNKKHNNKYCYDKAIYKSARDKIIIICPEHGEFLQTVSDHLTKNGCPKCGYNKIKQSKQFHTDEQLQYLASLYTSQSTMKKYDIKAYRAIKDRSIEFSKTCFKHMTGIFWTEKRAIAALKNSYVLLDPFFNISTPMTVRCVSCDTISTITLKKFNEGFNKCKNCYPSLYGFNENNKAILYYLELHTPYGVLYKIGITNRDVQSRYDIDDLTLCKKVYIKYFTKGEYAKLEEQRLLKTFITHKYVGPPVLKSGNTELFNKDIIQNKEDWWKHTYLKEEKIMRLEL